MSDIREEDDQLIAATDKITSDRARIANISQIASASIESYDRSIKVGNAARSHMVLSSCNTRPCFCEANSRPDHSNDAHLTDVHGDVQHHASGGSLTVRTTIMKPVTGSAESRAGYFAPADLHRA